MIWKIARKEFLLNLMTFKFAVGTILCVILVVVFVPVLAKDYLQRLEEYNQNVTANEAELRKVMVYKNILPTVYRPPNVLSVFSEGIEKRLGTSAKIPHFDVPEVSATTDEVNPYMSMFPALDVSLVLRIVFSALALLVAYNVISGEREQGTLKLILSSSIPRHHVLIGKFLAGLMVLIVPVTIVFILSLMILLSFPMIELSAANWAGIGLMYIASLIFISAMYNLGLFFSSLMKQSAISLILGLFTWVIFVVIVPSGSIYLATQMSPLEPQEKIQARREMTIQEYRDKQREASGKFPNWRGPKSDAEGAFGMGYTVVCDESCLHDSAKAYPLMQSIVSNYSNSIWRLELSRFDGLLKQKHLAGNIARFSPVSMYENVMSILAQSDFGSFRSFMDDTRSYREEITEYIRSKTDNFSSYSYFTICTEEDAREYKKNIEPFNESLKSENKQDRERARENFDKWTNGIMARRSPLDLQDFPRFNYRPGVAKSIKRAIPDIALLVIVNILLFSLSFVAFVRYDVRSD
jgi:ABC-type transport system involved in multi-copper enzyme maturation permease subunit